MRLRWLIAGWVACIAGMALLPGVYLQFGGSPLTGAILLAGITLTFGLALAPYMLVGIFWTPIALWTGSSLNLEVCCTQSQSGHAERMFGNMIGAPIAILIYVVVAQLLLKRSANPGVSFAFTAILFVGWMALIERADAYAMNELCPPICKGDA
ncbi:hypothetical protein [Mesorhizobium sp. WSM2239]|jgi:hypothetical protein|uniref:Uncharacterized protein n=2 Tax=unclassified Mesorhizobium TaxID=325217 RepID=A0AAU8D2S6_9HYPH